jgi:hypothetical protein
MDQKKVASQLILEILSNRSPELGARLKQKLNSLLVKEGFERFDEKLYGYKRFSDFLEHALVEHVEVAYPEGAGDTLVSLRRHLPAQAPVANKNQQKIPPELPVIPSNIWQAFANPDKNRKRFLHKETKSVLHYLESEQSEAKDTVARDADQYLEIRPIDPSAQLDWMKVFLKGVKLPATERHALEALIGETYSSAVNATFTRALGEHGEAWRHYRTNHVIQNMRDWAQNNKIRFDDLCVRHSLSELPQAQAQVQVQDKQEQPWLFSLTPRQQAARLLELLSEEEIARLVVPNLVNVFLIKPRV